MYWAWAKEKLGSILLTTAALTCEKVVLRRKELATSPTPVPRRAEAERKGRYMEKISLLFFLIKINNTH